MIRKTVLLFLAAAFGLGLMVACGALSPASSFAPTHPQELGPGRPQCTTCHADASLAGAQKPYAAFDHTAEEMIFCGEEAGFTLTRPAQDYTEANQLISTLLEWRL